jgi:uncharacterized glyoxalase superfamily protein PhnB
LNVEDAAGAIAFYRRAFGATEVMRLTDRAGNILHAEIRIGDSMVMLAPEKAEWGNTSPHTLKGTPVHAPLRDGRRRVIARAADAGAPVLSVVTDQFYGDRSGRRRWNVAPQVKGQRSKVKGEAKGQGPGRRSRHKVAGQRCVRARGPSLRPTPAT